VKLGFVTLGNNVPSTRFRFLPYIPWLVDRGHRCHLWTSRPSVYDSIPWLGWRLSHCVKRGGRYLQTLTAAAVRPDCIYLERGALHDASLDLDRRFRRSTRRLVLDIDDGIFLEQPEKIDSLIAMSDHCVVSNEPIAEYVSQRHSQVTIIPTAVPLSRFTLKPEPGSSDRRCVIGWMGTASNVPFLELCAPALRQLAERYDFELLVVASSPRPLAALDLSGVNVNFRLWQPEIEIESLHRMDIGLMPLPEGREWMKFKAATKLVQYMAVGIPAVASPIGVNANILAGEQVGLAASTTEQWTAALERLLIDPAQRRQMGRAGRRLVESTYSMEANAARLERVLCGTEVHSSPLVADR
jgi:glycosyltransferase involved in cell wall biosynthesis